MTDSFAKSKSAFCLLQNSNLLHLLLHLHEFHYIYLQILCLFTWCLSLLRSGCNHVEVSDRPLLLSLYFLLISYTSKGSLVMPALISFRSSEFTCVSGRFSVGLGLVSHSACTCKSSSSYPAAFYLSQFRLKENVLLLEVRGGSQVRLQGTAKDSNVFFWLLLQLVNKFGWCILNCILDHSLCLAITAWAT